MEITDERDLPPEPHPKKPLLGKHSPGRISSHLQMQITQDVFPFYVIFCFVLFFEGFFLPQKHRFLKRACFANSYSLFFVATEAETGPSVRRRTVPVEEDPSRHPHR